MRHLATIAATILLVTTGAAPADAAHHHRHRHHWVKVDAATARMLRSDPTLEQHHWRKCRMLNGPTAYVRCHGKIVWSS